jgi:hypothetical protein
VIGYASMEVSEYLPESFEDTIVGDDVKFMIRILNRCAKMGVPKEFAAGMMLLFLEFCEGVDVDAGIVLIKERLEAERLLKLEAEAEAEFDEQFESEQDGERSEIDCW